MIIINNDDEITFQAQSIIDGMKIGIMKEKFISNGIERLTINRNLEDDKFLSITIKQKDLLDVLT
jgi:hypothetical protein